MILSSAQR